MGCGGSTPKTPTSPPTNKEDPSAPHSQGESAKPTLVTNQPAAQLPETKTGVDGASEDDFYKDTPPAAAVKAKPPRNRNKRGSVSAECMDPLAISKMAPPKIVPKTDEAKSQVEAVLDKAILLKNLEVCQKKEIIDAVEEKTFQKDSVIIEQGEKDAQYFYMLSKGACQAIVDGKQVFTYAPGGTFGELALMYNAPRAATIKACEDCVCFALDRGTFQNIVIASNRQRMQDTQMFLSEVSLLQSLTSDERAQLADAIQPTYFKPFEVIVTEGEVGDVFYLLEKGEVRASHNDITIKTYVRGDYFGELALLGQGGVRKATCTALGEVKVGALDKSAFKRLLGPVEEILLRNAEHYEEVIAQLEGSQKP